MKDKEDLTRETCLVSGLTLSCALCGISLSVEVFKLYKSISVSIADITVWALALK